MSRPQGVRSFNRDLPACPDWAEKAEAGLQRSRVNASTLTRTGFYSHLVRDDKQSCMGGVHGRRGWSGTNCRSRQRRVELMYLNVSLFIYLFIKCISCCSEKVKNVKEMYKCLQIFSILATHTCKVNIQTFVHRPSTYLTV